MTSTDPDAGLIARCQDPNSEDFEAAFEALYHRYRDRVYSIAYRITGTASDAMDVAQETFGLLFRKISAFRGESMFSTWLFRIVVNCAIDANRQSNAGIQRKTKSLSSLPAAAQPVELEDRSPEASAQVGELGDHVHRAIQRLSPKLRAILVLRYLEHLNYDQLAATLDISMGTVKSRLARAHTALQDELAGTLEPFGFQAAGDGRYSAGPDREGVA